MICGVTTYVADAGQYKTCTVKDVHPNHDMPGPDNIVHTPHECGEYVWHVTYEMIGPEKEYFPNTCWNCDEPFPEFQHDNVIPFRAGDSDVLCGCFYDCPKCKIRFATIEFRKEYTT